MKVISIGKLIVKSWAENIEDSAIEQIVNLSNLPFAFKHIAIMPDVHTGYGMPIGGVLATKGVVIPNAVGVDIGCGMCALKTSLNPLEFYKFNQEIIENIKELIPLGFNHHEEKQCESFMPDILLQFRGKNWNICFQQYDSALKQIGTLGGGNHFIEIQKDQEDFVWIMIHSGSRNLGYKVAKYYNEIAIKSNERWYSQVPKSWELAFLPIETVEAKNYLAEMQYCVDFALANRKVMMDNVLKCFLKIFPNMEFDEMINIAHNYAQFENHFGENVIIHRKGATLARLGTTGIIPGSQGTKSYIVKGKGNPESFNSCSHGAGRLMSRKKAREELKLEDEIKILNDQNIIHGIREQKDLDEASSAYKNIDIVMENQKDLVDIKVELSPLAVIKG